jgi:ABC-type multidrug transport system fused ATPase/permease subunit
MDHHSLEPSEDAKFEAIYNHYVDSVGVVRSQTAQRDRLLAITILILAVMSFQIFLPQESGSILSEFVQKKLDVDQGINLAFLGTVLWFALLSTTLRYFQTVVYIERQYAYIHQVEEQISEHFPRPLFTREGHSYLQNYPLFANWAWSLYTIAFPLGLVLAVVWKLIGEITTTPRISWPALIADFSLCVMILISTSLYMLHIHHKK